MNTTALYILIGMSAIGCLASVYILSHAHKETIDNKRK